MIDKNENQTSRNDQIKNIAYWITTVLGPVSFVIGGVLHLMHNPEVVAKLNHPGYPAYFASVLGFWKLAGAIIIAAPRLPRLPLLKEWAYAGFFFVLTGASASNAFKGEPTDALFPLIFLVLCAASWAMRPASRKLKLMDEGERFHG